MLFSSMMFLWIFLPVVLVGNFLLGKLKANNPSSAIKYKNIYLLIASLVFYAWGGVYYLLLIFTVILINYIAGLLIVRTNNKKAVLITAILANIIIIGYFKYFNLIIHTVENISGHATGAFGLKEVILPIGISFFIFQAMSYVIDVYWHKTECQKNLAYFALYVALFPQLIAGPIVQYKDVAAQLSNREENTDIFVSGIRRFTFGLAKKVLIANILGNVVDRIWSSEVNSILASVAWFGMIAYTLQIYYDFSGYSDMAIGIGRMLGFEFKENFNMPYTSLSIKEFWRRWHISLSSWFRDYVYIPLGGSRAGALKTYRNLFLVFLLTGIWHGANYTFFFWGLYYAFFIILERALIGKYLEQNKYKVFNYIYTIMVVMIGWVFFRADSITDAFLYLTGLFRFSDRGTSLLEYLNFKVLLAFITGIFLSCPLWSRIKAKYGITTDVKNVSVASFVLQMVLLIISMIMLISGSYNPFIYYQF